MSDHYYNKEGDAHVTCRIGETCLCDCSPCLRARKTHWEYRRSCIMEELAEVGAELGKLQVPKTEPVTPEDWVLLNDTNMLASKRWRVLDSFLEPGKLPDPPPGSGCHMHYCWMPKAEGHDFCAAHGGADHPLPERE